MLYGFLVSIYTFIGLLLILLVFIQKGKGSLGLGNIGGGTQMLFGGSGGQDLFQKVTWILGGIFMFGSLTLAIMRSSSLGSSRYLKSYQPVHAAPQVTPPAPTEQAPQDNSTI